MAWPQHKVQGRDGGRALVAKVRQLIWFWTKGSYWRILSRGGVHWKQSRDWTVAHTGEQENQSWVTMWDGWSTPLALIVPSPWPCGSAGQWRCGGGCWLWLLKTLIGWSPNRTRVFKFSISWKGSNRALKNNRATNINTKKIGNEESNICLPTPSGPYTLLHNKKGARFVHLWT